MDSFRFYSVQILYPIVNSAEFLQNSENICFSWIMVLSNLFYWQDWENPEAGEYVRGYCPNEC